MRVVLDTSVLVAALRSSTGASHRVLQLLLERRFESAISTALYLEYEAVLLRPEHSEFAGSESEIRNLIRSVGACGVLQPIFYRWRPFLKDPDDDLLIELAVAAGCAYIVTHNLRDFTGSDGLGVKSLLPREFLKLIRS